MVRCKLFYAALNLEYEGETQHDAAATAWAKKTKTYPFVAALHMLSYVFPVLVKLSKQLDNWPALVAGRWCKRCPLWYAECFIHFEHSAR